MLMALDTGTVSESNNHTWDKKLPGGGAFKGTSSYTHRTKKDSKAMVDWKENAFV